MMAPCIRRDATQSDKMKIKISLTHAAFLCDCERGIISPFASCRCRPRRSTKGKFRGFHSSIARSQRWPAIRHGGPGQQIIIVPVRPGNEKGFECLREVRHCSRRANVVKAKDETSHGVGPRCESTKVRRERE